MTGVDMVMENSGPSFSGEFNITGDQDNGFQELVYNHKEGVMPIRVGESHDHVY